MYTTKIKLSGLTCPACEKLVVMYLSKINGVTEVVSHGDQSTFVINTERKLAADEVRMALEATSYEILSISC